MLLKVDFSLEMYRWLYPLLYSRVLAFAKENGEDELAVRKRFVSLVAGDPSINLLITLEDNIPTAHCLYTLQLVGDKDIQAFVEQIKADTGHDEAFVKDCIAYLEAIPNLTRIGFTTLENKYKAWKKKYNFKVFRVFMVKEVSSHG